MADATSEVNPEEVNDYSITLFRESLLALFIMETVFYLYILIWIIIKEEKPDPKQFKPDLYFAAKENDTEKVLSLLASNVPPTYIDISTSMTVSTFIIWQHFEPTVSNLSTTFLTTRRCIGHQYSVIMCLSNFFLKSEYWTFYYSLLSFWYAENNNSNLLFIHLLASI